MKLLTVLLAFSLCLLSGACAGSPPEGQPAPPAKSEGRLLEGFLEPSAVREAPRPPSAPAVLTSVRVASHPGFDRVVFEFQGGGLPGYRVAYGSSPAHDCGSGEPNAVAGGALLEVRLEPAQAHTEAGEATIPFRERALDLPSLKALKRTCDFEGIVTWALGVTAAKRFRATELSGPARLVVDVEH